MKRFASLLFCCLISCNPSPLKTESHLHSGDVFRQLNLPSPTNVRTGSGAPGQAYWQQRVDHNIQVDLNVDLNLLSGTQLITYSNNSPDTLDYIWIQLEQNIHKNDSIRSREGRPTGEGNHDGMNLSKVKVQDDDAAWTEYDTLARIELQEPLNPGSSIEIEIDWTFAMPKHAKIRMGFDDAYKDGPVWELAHWFPAPCVYDDVYGWNTLPYIGRGEFYTNFGDYEVQITVPKGFLVFASGSLQNEEEVLTPEEQERLAKAKLADTTVTIRSSEEVPDEVSKEQAAWKFTGKNIRTFAWATSKSFVWDASSVEIKNINGTSSRVLCQAAYPAENSKIWNEAVGYVQHSISYYSDHLYPYPWPQMSVVCGAAGGMEYPMLVYCRGRDHERLFNVTDHEVAHNWFPMMINTDERRHAWMDEGFNTFVNHYSLEAYYGDRKHKPDVEKYKPSRFMHDHKAVNTPPDLLKTRGHYSYRKPGFGLRYLREEVLGEERFDAAFKKYIERWVFKSPRPTDFYRTMEDAAGTDLQWFFRGMFEEPLQLDQAIVAAVPTQKQDNWSVSVVLQNMNDWVCPVKVQINCVDGSKHIFQLPVTVWAWSNQHKQVFTVPTMPSSVFIDPEETSPDINVKNNKWYF